MRGKGTALSRYLRKALLATLLCCLAILVATALVAHRRTRTHTVTYQLAPEQPPADRRMLEAAASLVRKRLDLVGPSCGLNHWTVEITPDGRLRLVLRTRFDPAEVLFWATMPGRVEFRLLHPDADVLSTLPPEELPEGYEVKCYRQYLYRLSRPGDLVTREHRYLVRAEPILRVSQFASVSFDTVGWHKRTVLTFGFTEAEGERFRDLTASNVGRQLAMLVDGELLLPPGPVNSFIEGDAVQIQGFFYNPPLRKLVKVLQDSPLPGRLEEISRQVE